ncbi:10778_t:CDS:1 [Paraglomus occultum]|uniref:10778_t:CDS:1 n=1 Tax=Paraglomus occultum TaxID=144539 RepID=A0A9N8WKR7_9GLOM|nr:10778_t:CDS:1 [Paraglomus occultum]
MSQQQRRDNRYHPYRSQTLSSTLSNSNRNYARPDGVLLFQNDQETEEDRRIQENPPYQLTLTEEALFAPGKRKSASKIPRPLNRFLLFRRDFEARFRAENQNLQLDAAFLAPKAKEAWKLLSEEEKHYFMLLQRKGARKHREKYPDYKYTPRRANKKPKKSRPNGKHREAELENSDSNIVLSPLQSPVDLSPISTTPTNTVPETIPSTQNLHEIYLVPYAEDSVALHSQQQTMQQSPISDYSGLSTPPSLYPPQIIFPDSDNYSPDESSPLVNPFCLNQQLTPLQISVPYSCSTSPISPTHIQYVFEDYTFSLYEDDTFVMYPPSDTSSEYDIHN